jgi:hypothetical protein
VANECLDSWIRSEEPGIFCKLELEKSYDRVNLGISAIFVEVMWFWEEIESLDRLLYFYGAVFHSYYGSHFGFNISCSLLQQGSIVSSIVCFYGGIN